MTTETPETLKEEPIAYKLAWGILSFLGGAAFGCAMATVQIVFIMGSSASLEIYYIPFLVGGIGGLSLGLLFYALRQRMRLLKHESVLLERTEKALRSSEMELSAFYNNAPIPMLVVDSERRVKKINAAALAMARRTENQVIGLRGGEVLRCVYAHDDPRGCGFSTACDSCVVRNTVLDTFKTQDNRHAVEASIPYDADDGVVPLWVLVSTSFLDMPDSEMVLVCMEDITERKMAEETIRKSETRLRNAQRVARLGFWDWNIVIDDLYWSEEVYRIFGFTPETFLSTNDAFLATVHPEDREFLARHADAALQDNAPYSVDHRIIRPDGEIRYVHEHGEVTRDAKGKPIRMFGIVIDITERKLVEQERERLIVELEDKNSELERFTYTVSHDLKTPLITIAGFMGMLKQDMAAGNDEAMEEDMRFISRAVKKMERLLDELLELSRIGRQDNPPEEVSLTELAKEVVAMISGKLEKQGIEVEISPNMPTVLGDRLRLWEVMQNLFDNAIKFMGDQPQPIIEIGSRADGVETIYYVRDNGMGIKPAFHEKIFGLFDRLNPKGEGTGVGLAVVKRIIEVHGGRIWVESEGPGYGSTFCFTIPPKKI